VSYALSTATRDQPVDPQIMQTLSGVVADMGPEYGIVVTSGGQPSHGHNRTGSTRHDHGGAVDFFLTRDGQRVNPGQDKALYSELISNSAAFFSGMGHYHLGMHVGGGKQAFWGDDGTSRSADPEFAKAYHDGKSNF
jgi:hypothetical protein